MHETKRIVPAVVLGIASIFIAASPSFGAPITYTEQATASGTLNGIAFTDDTVLLTMTTVRPTSLLADRASSLMREQ